MILFLSVLLPQMLIPQSIIVIYTLIIKPLPNLIGKFLLSSNGTLYPLFNFYTIYKNSPDFSKIVEWMASKYNYVSVFTDFY